MPRFDTTGERLGVPKQDISNVFFSDKRSQPYTKVIQAHPVSR